MPHSPIPTEQLFSQERAVRMLVCGGAGDLSDRDLAPILGRGGESRAWRVGYLELFGHSEGVVIHSDEISRLISPSILWRGDWQAVRGTFELTLIVGGDNPEWVNRYSSQEVLGLFDRLRGLGFEVSGGLGSVVRLDQLPQSFQQAQLAAGYGVVRGSGIYVFQPTKELKGLGSHDLDSFPHRFYATLLSKGPIDPLVEEFSRVLLATEASVRRIRQDIQKLFSSIADLLPATPSADRFYHILDLVNDPVRLCDSLRDLCALASRTIVERRSSLADRKVREFQDHVEKNFMDGNLNLRDVGRALHISPSYLAKLLKRSVGLTFVEFVTEYRMARARELLFRSDLLTYQIAEAVGYPYTHYFSATFKKQVGTTPSEFRAIARSRGSLNATAVSPPVDGCSISP